VNAQTTAKSGGLKNKLIGEWLCGIGMISPFQLSDALSSQQETGQKLGQVLVQKGVLIEKDLQQVLVLQQALRTCETLAQFPYDPDAVSLVPEAFARKNHIVPLLKVGRRLLIGMVKVDDTRVLDHLSLLSGYMVVPIAFRDTDIAPGLSKLFGSSAAAAPGPTGPSGTARVENTIEKAIAKSGAKDDAGKKPQIQDIANASDSDAPVVELVNSLLTDAMERGAADIAIDPKESGLCIRLRIDGVMTTAVTLPKAIETAVIARLKVMANMNITEKRRPQDGRFSVVINGEKIDFRCSCIATHWGERISLRALRQKSINLGLDKLGFSERDSETIQQILLKPVGIILVTGPTGSGKTTTLYAMLREFDQETESIITIEDPVEYPVQGIAQIQVNSKIDLTFSAALRTVLRQDPDTIMVGEIRDLETLETATSAAMTGHLVLSTLHTNDAVSTVSRMIEMGIPPYVVGSTVSGIIAQRLIRRICSNCKEEVEASPTDKAFLGIPHERQLTIHKGAGCEKCNNSGYKGMLGVYEILKMSRPIANLISRGEPTTVIQDEATKLGMLSILDDAKEKVLKGMSTVEEVIRCLGVGD